MQRRMAGGGLGAVVFTDIVGSTVIAAEMGNARWSELVSRHHRIVRGVIGRYHGREIDTAGDGFFISFERPADAIRCAVACADGVRQLGIEIRAGVAFGELGTVGQKPSGLVVNTAARVMSVAGPGEVLVPSAVRDIVPGAGVTFTDHGVHNLKGLEGEFRLFGVAGVDGRAIDPPLEPDEAVERRQEIFPGAPRRGALIVGLAVGVVAVMVGSVLLLNRDTAPPPARSVGPLEHAVASVDPETGRIGTTIDLGGAIPGYVGPSFLDHPLAAGEGGVWLVQSPVLYHVDPRHQEVRTPGIDVGIGASQVTTGFGSVWVLSQNTVYRVHPGTDEATVAVRLPPATGVISYSLAVNNGVWLAQSDGTVVRFDPRTGGRKEWDIGLSAERISVTDDAVWVADILASSMTALDQDTLQPFGPAIEITGSIDSVVTHDEDAWVLDLGTGVVTRIDWGSFGSSTARVGNDPTDIASGLGFIWVGDREGSLYRVDVSTLVVEEFVIGAEVVGVDVDESSEELWVYLGAATDPE
jgi:class 3 adenylate cyclase